MPMPTRVGQKSGAKNENKQHLSMFKTWFNSSLITGILLKMQYKYKIHVIQVLYMTHKSQDTTPQAIHSSEFCS